MPIQGIFNPLLKRERHLVGSENKENCSWGFIWPSLMYSVCKRYFIMCALVVSTWKSSFRLQDLPVPPDNKNKTGKKKLFGNNLPLFSRLHCQWTWWLNWRHEHCCNFWHLGPFQHFLHWGPHPVAAEHPQGGGAAAEQGSRHTGRHPDRKPQSFDILWDVNQQRLALAALSVAMLYLSTRRSKWLWKLKLFTVISCDPFTSSSPITTGHFHWASAPEIHYSHHSFT